MEQPFIWAMWKSAFLDSAQIIFSERNDWTRSLRDTISFAMRCRWYKKYRLFACTRVPRERVCDISQCAYMVCVYYQSLRDVFGFPGTTQGRAQSRLVKLYFGSLHNHRTQCLGVYIVPISHGVRGD